MARKFYTSELVKAGALTVEEANLMTLDELRYRYEEVFGGWES